MALTKSLSFSLRRKRVLISDNNNNSCSCKLINEQFCLITPMKKKRCFPEIHYQCSSSLLEDLPQELLIKVVCGVDHDDLKQLFLVSKTVRDSAIIAKNMHFAYSTPSKTKAFRNSIEMLNNLENFDEIIVPNAPKQAHRKMKRCRFEQKTHGNVAAALFADEDVVQSWPRRSLFTNIDS
ncbi:F-box protein SKIP27-like [Silene latifolia]|uniref:F-box protein SKIP27-like n=1 Tax=Silene latifolia TaxID=37657 RepID=UPI003D78146A